MTAWHDALSRQARAVLESHRVVVHDNNNNNVSYTYTYTAPCAQAKWVQESTSTLLVARVDGRGGTGSNTSRTCSALAWDALESLFAVQGVNGVLPRYRYSSSSSSSQVEDRTVLGRHADEDADEDALWYPYIPHTNIPTWQIFQPTVPSRYLPPNTSLASKTGLHSSTRITSLPLQASTVLDVFAWSEQSKDNDLVRLARLFQRLYEHHAFLHQVVMRGCVVDAHERGMNQTGLVPCYNVIHPWETLVHVESPLWTALWDHFQLHYSDNTFDDPPVSLARCISNATSQCRSSGHPVDSTTGRLLDRDCDDKILRQCPFAVLDVGYAAALYRSDVDLLQMARLLQKARLGHSSTVADQIDHIEQWMKQSEHVLWNLLWNQDHQSFLSRHVVFERNETHSHVFVAKSWEWLDTPVATNFLVEWSFIPMESRRSALLSHMLQQTGNESFACGSYPVWSMGGCDDQEVLVNATIDPILNNLVSLGLRHSGEGDVGRYLADSTLRLVCGLENTVEHSSNVTCHKALFPSLYHAQSGKPLATTLCDGTSTATAAVVLDMLLPEFPRHYTPPPPIRTSWAIVLVVAELLVAASIAVSCLVMSLKMIRRLGDIRSEEYVRMVTPRYAEGHFFSATASFASSNDGNYDIETNE